MKSLALIASHSGSIVSFRGHLVSAWIGAGVQVYALAPDHDESTRREVRELGADPVDFSLARAAISPLRDLRDLARLTIRLRRLSADAVFTYTAKPVVYGTLAARLARVPVRFALLTGLGQAFSGANPVRGIRRRLLRAVLASLYRLTLRHNRKVFFQNPDDLSLFVERRIVDPSRAVLLAGSGVDLAHFPPAPPVVDPPTFLTIARLLPEKGVRELVAAAERVRQRHPRCRFVLVGGVPSIPRGLDEQEVGGWVEKGLIEWAGRVPDVRPWLARASVYVLPSYYGEGVPRSTLEALAMGRPVITTDTPGCRETVTEGENGFLVPPRDAAALAAAMERFVEEPELIEEMGRKSRRLAEARFDVHEVNAAILEAMGL